MEGSKREQLSTLGATAGLVTCAHSSGGLLIGAIAERKGNEGAAEEEEEEEDGVSWGRGPYDERFTGYGKNKIELVMRLRASGWTFFVLPRAFAVHVPHPTSAAHAHWRGNGNAKTAHHRSS